ncbi:MAG: alpha-glucan phosphorylase, partial [Anaerolineae bacterium]
QIRIDRLRTDGTNGQELRVGDQLQVQAEIYLGELKPTDVAVELYYGPLDSEGLIVDGEALPALIAKSKGKGSYVFAGAISCRSSGRHGYALRILPYHEDLGNPFEMGLILWGA